MEQDTPPPPAERAREDQHAHHPRSDLREQFKSTRAGVERQMQATRAQFDATSERIKARTGRNLILAIAIGLGFGAVLLLSLIFVKEIFMVLAAGCAAFAAFELTTALRTAGYDIPRSPTIISAVAMVPAVYYWHENGQLIAIAGGILLCWVWRLVLVGSPGHRAPSASVLRDLGASTLIQVYVVFLASFAILLLEKPDGQWWTLGFIILVVAADVGAYSTGLLLGKHPMAPTISPKKTWEGFAGASAAAIVAGVLVGIFMVHQPWWFGVLFGVVILLTATLGDLTESLIKRDIGVKDMSSWLPGHGGFLDRLDSILPSAAAAFALFLIFS